MKLLLVEDNKSLAEDMISFLADNKFIVEYADTYTLAQEKAIVYKYDLVIIDIGLPDGNGLDLIPIIQQNIPECGILVVTARNAIEDKVKGLDLGADDYITKPFHPAELNARIKSIIRRKFAKGESIIEVDELKIDLQSNQVSINNIEIKFTKKEYDLLLYFNYNQGKVLTKENIAEHLWGDHIDQADHFDFIYNHIKNLRKKLINAGGKDRIESVYGIGYKFVK